MQEHIDRIKLYIINGVGGSVTAAKSSQSRNCMRTEEKGSGAPRGVIRQPAGVACGGRGAGRGGARGARAPTSRAAPLASRQSPADSACACVSRCSVHRTRAPNTTRAALPWPRTRPLATGESFPPTSATCYDLTFGHLRYLTRLTYPSSCKCYPLIILATAVIVEFGTRVQL